MAWQIRDGGSDQWCGLLALEAANVFVSGLDSHMIGVVYDQSFERRRSHITISISGLAPQIRAT